MLTCAHNFYTPQGLNRIRYNDDVEVYVAPCGRLGTPLRVQNIYVPEEFQDERKNRNRLFDYALVKLIIPTNLEDFIPLKCDFLDKFKT